MPGADPGTAAAARRWPAASSLCVKVLKLEGFTGCASRAAHAHHHRGKTMLREHRLLVTCWLVLGLALPSRAADAAS
jgi:hypothetical protein